MYSRHLSYRSLVVLLLSIVLVAQLTSGAWGAAPAAPSIKDEMRQPWTRDLGYLRTWLLCGPFPNPPLAGGLGSHEGLSRDYLTDRGGEAPLRPTEGMTHALSASDTVAWQSYTSPQNFINLQAYFSERKLPAVYGVAYAFTTLTRSAEEQTVLSIGSDDGVRVWVNGQLVVDHAISRGAAPDQELIPVTLRAGENTLLLKIDQGDGGWGFYARLLDAGEARLFEQQRLSPSLSPETTATRLIVNTDTSAASPGGPSVQVDVYAPGGEVVADQHVPRGDPAIFDATTWAEGPYEAVVHLRLPNGEEKLAYVPWYKGDVRAAAQKIKITSAIMQGSKSIPSGNNPFEATYAMLTEMITDRLGGPPATAKTEQLPLIYDQLMELAELKHAQAGGVGGAHAHGMVRLAYIDDIDGSPQWCRAYLPANYTPEKQWPLVVVLHGYNGANPPYIRWWSVADRHDRFADLYDVIVIHPMGRYNTGYNGIGDRDVLRAIELAKQRFSVDEDRVYLMGYSMGGGGVWHVGTRHPEIFAALVPIYGGFDYRFYLPEDLLPKLSSWERLRFDKDSSFSQAEQLLNLPIWVIHGDADAVVDVAHSRYAVRMLQRWGYNIRYWEVPGLGHDDVGELREPFRWMLAQRRNANPTQVRVRSGDLTYAAAYWLRVTQREHPMHFIATEARVIGPNTIQLDTDNVLEVVLAPKPPVADPAQPLQVVWNGKSYTAPFDKQGHVTLRAASYQPTGLVKTPMMDGPVAEVNTTPFAIVQGTISPDPMMRRLCEWQAQRGVRDWEGWQHARPRLFKDTEISEEDLRRYSLILIGGPEENAVTKRFSSALPLRISSREIRLDGRAFPVKDAVVQMVYPHPLNPERYLLVLAATSPAGMYLSGSFPEAASAVDFCILDNRIPDTGQGRPEEQVLPAMGVFDAAWKLSPTSLMVGEEKIRATCPVRTAPTRLSTEVKENRLWLSEVLESSCDGHFARMMRDCNWTGGGIELAGRRYRRGIAVNTMEGPNGADFDLHGAWKQLRGVIGLEFRRDATQQAKDNTHVFFIVKGDGKELYRSPEFTWGSRPVKLEVDVTGVKIVRLEVAVKASAFDATASADWADVRLER